jgi:hypothetical protein
MIHRRDWYRLRSKWQEAAPADMAVQHWRLNPLVSIRIDQAATLPQRKIVRQY